MIEVPLPITLKSQLSQYFECLIFIREEFTFRWRCYKLQRSSTDMYRICACYKSTYRSYQLTYALTQATYTWVQSINTCYQSTYTRVQSTNDGSDSFRFCFQFWFEFQFPSFFEAVLIALLKFGLDQGHPSAYINPLE